MLKFLGIGATVSGLAGVSGASHGFSTDDITIVNCRRATVKNIRDNGSERAFVHVLDGDGRDANSYDTRLVSKMKSDYENEYFSYDYHPQTKSATIIVKPQYTIKKLSIWQDGEYHTVVNEEDCFSTDDITIESCQMAKVCNLTDEGPEYAQIFVDDRYNDPANGGGDRKVSDLTSNFENAYFEWQYDAQKMCATVMVKDGYYLDKVRLFQDEKYFTKNAGEHCEFDLDHVKLTAICVDKHDHMAKFRVSNGNAKSVEVTWDVYGTDHDGMLMVEGGAKKYFTVPTADDGSATVRLFYEGEQIEVKASNTEKMCDLGMKNVDPDEIKLTAICVDTHDDLAKFRVMNNNEKAVDVTWDVYKTDYSGGFTVGGGATKYFVVPTKDDGSATVRLFYKGKQVEVKASNTKKECDLGKKNGMDAFQLDLACGKVIKGIGDTEDAYYGRQGRLVQAVSILDDGTLTRSFNHPHGDSRTVMKGDCELTYGRFDYDAESGKVRVTVSLADHADCDGKTLTLAGYELPEGTTEFQRERASEQMLVDYQTMMLAPGEEKTLVICLDD
jgi:hypothetical protein